MRLSALGRGADESEVRRWRRWGMRLVCLYAERGGGACRRAWHRDGPQTGDHANVPTESSTHARRRNGDPRKTTLADNSREPRRRSGRNGSGFQPLTNDGESRPTSEVPSRRMPRRRNRSRGPKGLRPEAGRQASRGRLQSAPRSLASPRRKQPAGPQGARCEHVLALHRRHTPRNTSCRIHDFDIGRDNVLADSMPTRRCPAQEDNP